jgi:serine/threonine-protein kinase
VTAIVERRRSITYRDPLIGELLGKDYRVVERIGAGGMAVVYLVEHQTLLKRFAAKVLSNDLASNLEARARFIEEAHAASQLDHEHIVSISDFGVTLDNRPFFVMEMLHGKTLEQRMADGPMRLEEIVAICVPVARALAYAHAEGIVHRDVKPENVFLVQRSQNRWTVKVVDFGIAQTPLTMRLAKVGQVLGSPNFMSPEACLGDDVDGRADVYSFGVVLYLMLCGRLPFEDESFQNVMRMHVSVPLPPPAEVNPALPPQLAALVERALHKDRDARYGSMDELLVDLEAALPPGADRLLIEAQAGGTSAFRITPFPGLAMSSQRIAVAEIAPAPPVPSRSRLLPVLVAIVVAGALAAGYLLWIRRDDSPVASRAVAQASLVVDTVPPGAAIFINGEPTGAATPATLTGLTPGKVSVRVELSDYSPATRTVELAEGATTKQQFRLDEGSGRVAIAELPHGAVMVVDGVEYPAGEVMTLPVGRHAVRIVVDGREVLTQAVDTTPGHQVWALHDGSLVKK